MLLVKWGHWMAFQLMTSLIMYELEIGLNQLLFHASWTLSHRLGSRVQRSANSATSTAITFLTASLFLHSPASPSKSSRRHYLLSTGPAGSRADFWPQSRSFDASFHQQQRFFWGGATETEPPHLLSSDKSIS